MTLTTELPALLVRRRQQTEIAKTGTNADKILCNLTAQFPDLRYTRSNHYRLGPLTANIEINGDTATLSALGPELIGHYLYEGNGHTWSGTITGFTLITGDEAYEASLADVANAVRAKYKVYEPDASRNLLRNGGFTYGSDVSSASPQHWDRYNSESKISRQFTITRTGNAALKLAQQTSVSNNCYQSTRVKEGTPHMLRFWTRGDGASGAARYKIQNAKALTDLVAETGTGVTGTTWTLVEVDFVVPVGCNEIAIILSNSAAGDSYIDDVDLLQYDWIEKTTDFYENAPSINRYGRREIEIESAATTTTAAQREAQSYLAAHQAPWGSPRQIDLYATNEPISQLILSAEGPLVHTAQRIEFSSLNTGSQTTDPTAMGNDEDEPVSINRDTETDTVSNLIAHTLDNGSFDYRKGAIAPNDTETSLPRGDALSVLKKLITIPDSNGNHYGFETVGAAISYQRLPTTPTLYRFRNHVNGAFGQRLTSIFDIQPGIWRTSENPIVFERPANAWPPGRTDFVAAEVHVGNDGSIRIVPENTENYYSELE